MHMVFFQSSNFCSIFRLSITTPFQIFIELYFIIATFSSDFLMQYTFFSSDFLMQYTFFSSDFFGDSSIILYINTCYYVSYQDYVCGLEVQGLSPAETQRRRDEGEEGFLEWLGTEPQPYDII